MCSLLPRKPQELVHWQISFLGGQEMEKIVAQTRVASLPSPGRIKVEEDSIWKP